MKREALVRALRKYAKRHNLAFELDKSRGAGSHYMAWLDGRMTTIQSGELDPLLVKRICGQLNIDPAAL